jgi:hypothetical protein
VRRERFGPVAALLIAALAISGAIDAPLTLDRVAWLQGCWEARSPSRVIEENWMAPRGGTMIGTGRTVRADTLAEYELIVLRAVNGTLAYEAHPSGQAVATFTAREAGDSVVFSNPAHDFPQRVGYRRVGADSLVAWIEGERNGRTRRIEFLYRRVRCAGSQGP